MRAQVSWVKGGLPLRALVFVESRLDCEALASLLRELPRADQDFEAEDWIVCALHGGLDQADRASALRHFQSSESSSLGVGCRSHSSVHVLVCTDVAARGLNVSGVTEVVSLSLDREPQVSSSSFLSMCFFNICFLNFNHTS